MGPDGTCGCRIVGEAHVAAPAPDPWSLQPVLKDNSVGEIPQWRLDHLRPRVTPEEFDGAHVRRLSVAVGQGLRRPIAQRRRAVQLRPPNPFYSSSSYSQWYGSRLTLLQPGRAGASYE